MRPVKFKGPFIGVQKNLDSDFMGTRDAEDAQNVNLNLGTLQSRPGWTQDADLSAHGQVTGLYEYVQNDGTLIRLAKAGTKLFKIVAGTPTEIGSAGFSSTELAKFTTVNNRVYICEGTVFKVTDGTSIFNAPIARPTTTVTLSTPGAVGSGKLKGDYDYKFTAYSTTWGQESPASDASAIILGVNNQNVLVSGLPGTHADSRVDRIRLYRRKVSAAESLWTFYKDVPIADLSDTDDKRDNDLDPTLVAPLSYTATLPAFRHMAYQAGVLFLAGDSNELFFTRVNSPWEVDTSIQIGSSGDSDPITGLWAYQGVVIVFKRHSIWQVSGNSKDTIFPRRLTSGVGCAAGQSIVEVDGILYFLGERSFYAFDGANDPIDIGDRAKSDLVNRNFSRDKYVVAIQDHSQNAIYWSYSGTQAAVNDKFYAYFYENSKRIEERSLCPWTFNPQEVTSFGLFSDSSTKVRSVYMGFNEGKVAKLTGNSDDGTGIIWFWRTGRFDGGVSDRKKRWGEIWLENTQQASSTGVDVKYYLDGGAAAVLATHDQSGPIFRRNLGRSSKDLRIELYGNNANPNEIIAWGIAADVAGRV